MNLKYKVKQTIYNKDKGWYVYISANKPDNYTRFGPIKTNITLVVIHNDSYIEWIPGHGPISFLEKANKEDANAQPCYVFDYNKGRGKWWQMACDKYNLNDEYVAGNWDYIFGVLEKFF